MSVVRKLTGWHKERRMAVRDAALTAAAARFAAAEDEIQGIRSDVTAVLLKETRTAPTSCAK